MPSPLKAALTEARWDLRRQSLGSALRVDVPLSFVDAVAADPYEDNRLWACDQYIARWVKLDPEIAVREISLRLEKPRLLWTERRDRLARWRVPVQK